MTNWSFLNFDTLKALGFDADFIEKALPAKYKKGLTAKEQQIAKQEAKETMKRAKNPKISPKSLYKDWESDKRFRRRNEKIPKSKATEAFEKQFEEFSESAIEEALANKAKSTGFPLAILREVYNRGMAAWRSGHRPGVAPQQWALGRVNSFVTGVGKSREADADLWKKAKSK